MTPVVSFQTATPADVPAVLDMMADFNAIDGYPFDADLTRNNLLHFVNHPELGRLWLLCIHTDTIVGYACLAFGFSFEYRGRDAFLDELYIKPSFRNQGIGQKALDFIEAEAVGLGVNAIHLEVEHHNAVGNGIYEKRGFKGKQRYMLTKRL